MKVNYYCRHSTFDTEQWYCSLKKGARSQQIANYRLDMSPAVNARQSVDMKLYGYLETYDELPDDMKKEFQAALKKLGATLKDIEFTKPRF